MSREEFDKVKKLFTEVKDAREISLQLFTSLDIKINKLHEIYQKLVKDNKDIDFVIGLDSFNFQKILLRKEYENLHVIFKMILNRIYFDYFKLAKMIKNYVNEYIEDINIKDAVRSYSQYPIYDTLKIHKEYDFDTVTLLYQDLVNTLIVIEDFCSNEENRLQYYIVQQDAGLNINNFVLSFTSNLVDIRNKNKLFKDSIEFFVTLHNTYFKRFLTSLRILHSRVKKDISFDESTLNTKKSTSLIVNELTHELDDKDVINEITRQISDDTSNDTNSIKSTGTPVNKKENDISAVVEKIAMETQVLQNSIDKVFDKKSARLSRLPSLPFINSPPPFSGMSESSGIDQEASSIIEKIIEEKDDEIVDIAKEENEKLTIVRETIEELSEVVSRVSLSIEEKEDTNSS